jgi:hypothetical protein
MRSDFDQGHSADFERVYGIRTHFRHFANSRDSSQTCARLRVRSNCSLGCDCTYCAPKRSAVIFGTVVQVIRDEEIVALIDRDAGRKLKPGIAGHAVGAALHARQISDRRQHACRRHLVDSAEVTTVLPRCIWKRRRLGLSGSGKNEEHV